MKPSARTVYGLLSYLSGFKLGYGLNPSTHNTEVKENANLNLFAKLFNGVLQITYSKYPYVYPLPGFSPINPSNIYPNHLQPPIWYPHLFLPHGHSPINQQQIINLHEPLNPNEAPNENYQEISSHNTQEIHNNLDMKTPVEIFEPIKNIKPISIVESKRKICEDDKFTCVEAIETDLEENSTYSKNETETSNHFNDPAQNVSNTTTVHEETSNSSHSNAVPEVTTIRSEDSNHFSTNLVTSTISTAENVSNSTDQLFSKPFGYSHPYYHYYKNASAYQHISITERPLKKIQNVIKYDSYDHPYDIQNYPSNVESFPFSQTKPADTSFYPMGGSYFDNGHGYENILEEKFNKKQEESEFIPIVKSNYI